MVTDRSGAERPLTSPPTVLRLHTRTGLAAPAPPSPPTAAHGNERYGRQNAPGIVTGGGLLASVESGSGITGIWRGNELVVSGVQIRVGQSQAVPVAGFRSARGTWSGVYRLGGGAVLRETGLLPDVTAAAVFQWTLSADPTGVSPTPTRPVEKLGLRVTFRGMRGGATLDVPISTAGPTVLAVLPEGEDPEVARTLLEPIEARQRQRARRGPATEAGPFRLVLDGSPAADVEAALGWIDDASLAAPGGDPPSPVLEDIRHDGPSYLAGAELAEVGLGALGAGRRLLARDTLKRLADDPTAAPAPLLHLAARYALWTSDFDLLAPMMTSLERAANTLPGARTPGFPSDPEVLELLRSALEPFGEAGSALTEVLREAANRPRLATLVSRTGPENPPESRTLRAARLLRSWIEKELGLEPDAAYGRLRIAPRFSGDWRSLALSGIAVGDAALRLEVVRSSFRHEFHFAPEAGRVPVNLVFAPWLPLARVSEVRIGNEVAKVHATPARGGVRIQLQLPLDRERSVTVVGLPRGGS